MRRAFEYLVSGCIVYFVVAACSASGDNSYNDGTANNSGAGNGSDVGGYGGLISNGGDDVTAGISGENHSGGNSASGGNNTSGGNNASGGMMDNILDPVPNAAAQSGTRLKAKWIIGADGSKEFKGWRDTLLNVDCSFTATAKGLRCVPPTSVAASYYSDASCTAPVLAEACNNGNAYAFEYDPATCAVSGGKMYKVGGAYTAAMVYVKSGATCQETPTTPGLAYSSLTEVDPAMFAAGTETVDP